MGSEENEQVRGVRRRVSRWVSPALVAGIFEISRCKLEFGKEAFPFFPRN